MIWTVEKLEDVLNYLKVTKGAKEIFELSLTRNVIGYWGELETCYCTKLSSLYMELEQKQASL